MHDSLLHFDGQRYKLIAWVVMPNHVHAVVELHPDVPLGKLMHSWKGYVACMANRILNRTGQFWMDEYHDRKVRDDTHLNNAIRYIEYNPVRAKLVSKQTDWPYSSAGLRQAQLDSAEMTRNARAAGLVKTASVG